MPRLDGTGPMGMGPMTGRGFGYCGRGRGYRWCQPAPRFGRIPNAYRLSPKEEREMLLREKELLEAELEAIKKELEE